MFAPLYKPLSGLSEWSDPHHEAVQPARFSSHELGANLQKRLNLPNFPT